MSSSHQGLVSTLQQHFLLFSQRLHSAEVERRGLRLEVATLKKGLRQEREDTCTMVRLKTHTHTHLVPCKETQIKLSQAFSRVSGFTKT